MAEARTRVPTKPARPKAVRRTRSLVEVARGDDPSSPRLRWTIVSPQARAEPIRMDWAWVSVPT